ncbi:SRPBCC domain-containing protein [Streptomyces sp. NBC_00335]|uniref:SRPBCC family protein n=1 Tax=unclassified Streptomyces TaxID=2593676 RepID=UPI0022552101|nr:MULTISPECIES: SRPBCC domain-containing protein [unclassified Streptomyces]MCX5405662.1 SRPBCC domain-containing protein [Streptomyces sp. NBC_00086]
MTPPATPSDPETPMDTVTLERRIAARPETLFALLTDREKWLSWMGADGTFSFEPGGSYRTRVTGENVASGRFLTLTPPERLVFTWGWEAGTPLAAGSTRVEITLEPTPAGTLLHLIHSGLPTSEACEAHAELWQHYVDRLALRAEGGDPGPDPWARRPAG